MTKQIDTLIEDITALFDGSYEPSEPTQAMLPLLTGIAQECDTEIHLTQMVEAIREAVKISLATAGKKRPIYLRMSNIGKPDRQLWYEHQESVPDKEELRADTYIKFLYGHIIEALLIFLAKEAGHNVTHEQAALEINGVKGHMDCEIDGVVVDVKSASKYGFDKFKNGEFTSDDPFGYVAQMSAYSQARQKKGGAFLVMEKSLGKLTLAPLHDMEMIDAAARIDHMKEVVASDEAPERCYAPLEDGKSGNLKLCVACSYCAFKTECWRDANDGEGLYTYLYSTGPRYLTTVVREPKVDRLET